MQPDIATHILTFITRGIFTSQEFAIVHYPAKGLTSDKLYFMVWEVIKALESLGFKVYTMSCNAIFFVYTTVTVVHSMHNALITWVDPI